MLIRRRSARPTSKPSAFAKTPRADAKRSSVARLPPISSASLLAARRPRTASRTSGHQAPDPSRDPLPDASNGDERRHGRQPDADDDEQCGQRRARREVEVEVEARLGEQEQDAEQEHLDDRARERVDRPGRDGSGRRHAVTLEEADVDRHAREVRRQRDFMYPVASCIT